MKSMGILGIYSGGNYDRDSDAAIVCRDREAMIKIGREQALSPDQATKAIGVGLLSKLFTHVRDLSNEVIGKIGICIDKGRELADHFAKIMSSDEKYFCDPLTITQKEERGEKRIAAQRAHELALANAAKLPAPVKPTEAELAAAHRRNLELVQAQFPVMPPSTERPPQRKVAKTAFGGCYVVVTATRKTVHGSCTPTQRARANEFALLGQ
jgi:hypothetical protein